MQQYRPDGLPRALIRGEEGDAMRVYTQQGRRYAEHVGSVGLVAESGVQHDGERSHRIEFETMSCQGVRLPAAHIELISLDDPLAGHPLPLSAVDQLVNGYRRPGAPPDRQEQ